MSDRTLRLFPYFTCANSEGSGEYHNLMSWLKSILHYGNIFCVNLFPRVTTNYFTPVRSPSLTPLRYQPRHKKNNNVTVRPAKTQISLGIRSVWSESSLCAQWVAEDPSFLHADSENSDQTGRKPRLIRVFSGSTLILLVLSCRGSYFYLFTVNPNIVFQTTWMIIRNFYTLLSNKQLRMVLKPVICCHQCFEVFFRKFSFGRGHKSTNLPIFKLNHINKAGLYCCELSQPWWRLKIQKCILVTLCPILMQTVCLCLQRKPIQRKYWHEPHRDKTNKMACAPSEGSDQHVHPPSLIRVFAVRSMGSWGPKLSSCGQRKLWSDWADAQADLSLRWTHMPSI